MLDTILEKGTSTLDQASEVLGGGAGPRAAGSDAPLVFENGRDIRPPNVKPEPLDVAVGGTANPVNVDPIIEFIHFGRVHRDVAPSFVHEQQSDIVRIEGVEPNRPSNDDAILPRALAFRAALEREALLLAAFMGATQTVLGQQAKGQGTVGQLLEVGANLLGGSGSTATKHSPADLDPMIAKVKAAATAIIGPEIQYAVIHKAGMDLHQARLNYQAYLTGLVGDDAPAKTEGGGGGGVLGSIQKLGSVAAGGAKVLDIVQGIAFKPFDVFMTFFLKLEAAFEPVIERACHDISLEAIVDKSRSPIFPIWSPPPPSEPSAEPEPTPASTSSGPGGLIDRQKQDLQKRVKDSSVGRTSQKLQDFMARKPEQPVPGKPWLHRAITLPKPAPVAAPAPGAEPVPEQAVADLAVKAFFKALGVSSLPGFLQTLLVELMAINVEFLTLVYVQLTFIDPSETIREGELAEAATRLIYDKLLRMLCDRCAAAQKVLDTVDKANLAFNEKSFVDGKALREKGQDKLIEELAPHVQKLVAFAMKSLVAELNAARAEAAAAHAVTMEVFLGRYPWLVALLFRNTFFPIWDLIIEKVFGSATKALGPLIGKTSSFFQSTQDKVNDLHGKIAGAKKARDYVMGGDGEQGEGAQVGTGGQNISDIRDKYREGRDGIDTHEGQALAPSEGTFVFPLTGRKPDGRGVAIALADHREVRKTHQWKTT